MIDQQEAGRSDRRVVSSVELWQSALQQITIISESTTTSTSSISVSPSTSSSQIQRGLPPLSNFSSSNIPSFKRIPGTRFIVDGFRHAGPWSMAYFLSHFHADHYSGLTPAWNKGIIFCSHITARLIIECIKIPAPFICPLVMGETVCIDSCLVTLVEANHCPGAVQMLFQVPNPERGSYMGCDHADDMENHIDTTYCNPKFVFPTQNESINYIVKTIYALMKEAGEKTETLDSADCKHNVTKVEGLQLDLIRNSEENIMVEEKESLQEGMQLVSSEDPVKSNVMEVEASLGLGQCCKDDMEYEGYGEIQEVYTEASISISDLRRDFRYQTLFLISTYVVGKEKILMSVAKQCNCKIYVNKKKISILKCLDLEDLEVFNTDPLSTNVHVVPWNFLSETWPFFRPNFRNMEKILESLSCTRVVGFVPTGWTYETRKKGFSVRRKGPVEIHLVPYSEHSNYDELRKYVAFLRPKEIIPTVGFESGDMDSKSVAAMRKHFRNLVDETANKRKFLKGFCRKPLERCEESHVDNAKDLETPPSKLSKPTILVNNCGANAISGGMDTDAQMKQKFSGSRLCELPRAVFGRKSKKRLSDVSVTADSVIGMVKKQKMAIYTEGLLSSSHNELSDRELSSENVSGYINKKKQLKAILPMEVSEEELDMLLLRAKRDLNLAVTLYFEGSGKDDTKHKEIHKRPKSVETLDIIGRTSCLPSVDASITQQTSSRCSLSDSTKVEKATTSVSIRKRSAKPSASIQNKTGRGSQSSILSFFKKNDTNMCAPTNSKKGDYIIEFEKPAVKTMEALDSYCNGGRLFSSETKKIAASGTILLNMLRGKEARRLGKDSTEEHKKEARTCSVAVPISEYKPIEHACWKKGECAPYIHLARTFELVELESGRLRTSDMLCNMFRSLLALSPESVLPATYLATNRIAPDYENVDLNVGGSVVSAAITDVTGTQKTKIKEMYNTMGDLGDVAQMCRQTQSLLVAPQTLTIQQVYSTLVQISKEVGSGSSSRRKGLIVSLLRACREKEMKYIVRTLVQNMRIGAMIRSVLPALAQAVVLHSCLAVRKIDMLKAELITASAGILDAYNMIPNLNILISSLLKDGIKAVMNDITASPGIPMKPMLAKIAKGVVDLFKQFQGKAFTCEYKYDGQRAQVHLIKDGSIKIFSRNCEDTTSRFPDVIENVRKALKPGIQDLIFDAEVVAVDRTNNNKLMAFQYLSTRERGGRGTAVSTESIKVDVCVFVFDLMYMNGELLVKMSLQDRRKRMHECFENTKDGSVVFANQTTIEAANSDAGNPKELARVNDFLDEAISSSCEGIMVKALEDDSNYAPSKRSDSWLKVKKDYVEGLHDTLDLVPIGAWCGNGRKAGWYSPFLLACYDPDHDVFQSVCRVMSGFTDVFYKQMKEFFSGDRLIPHKPTYYHTLEEPEVWFPPELVWEIRGADLTVSPIHQAAVGLVHPSRGISLRFPRFIRQRPDKSPDNANSSSDIADLFCQQNRKLDI